MKFKLPVLSALCLLTLVSCGKSGGGSSRSKQAQEETQGDMLQSKGEFRALLRPMNTSISGWFPSGVAEVRIENDDLEVKSWMDDAANAPHMQSIHLGTVCPTELNDTNQDGFVDARESLQVVKGAILPMDGDLHTQSEEASEFPMGANYTYLKRSSLSQTLQDLWLPDENPNDHVIKINKGSGLGVEGRVVIIYGSASTRKFPTSVAPLSGYTVQQSIPIACGILQKMPQKTTSTYP